MSKELTEEVLKGDMLILQEAIELSTYSLASDKDENIRIGAMKIVEFVAFKRPELVAPNLDKLFPALDAKELGYDPSCGPVRARFFRTSRVNVM